jgi:CheY-like chemotaxis protein
MIDMHGGAIGVDMEREGQGSMFFIELAVVGLRGIESSFFCSCVVVDTNHVFAELNDEDIQKGSHSVTVNHSPCPSCDHPSEQNFRILIVDDAALCRKFHIRTLKGNTAGEYVEANDGVEAVEKVKESIESRNAFSAILMDSSMPRMNGVDATRAIRALGYAGKIFAITGNGFTSDIDEFISAGADDVLVKPVTAESYSKIFASLQ